jgi:hypothetical protein
MQPSLLPLLDQMEDIIARAPTLPVGGRIVVSRGQLLDLIDALHAEVLRLDPQARQAPAGTS